MNPRTDENQNEGRTMVIHGNEACVHGAIAAGCRFFAGYPITPASEVAETMARELPNMDGFYVQFEDEIGSIAAVIVAARWGTHGDHEMIALAPNSVQECCDLMIECFNFSERYRHPVIFLMDGEIGHLRERLVLPHPPKGALFPRGRLGSPAT